MTIRLLTLFAEHSATCPDPRSCEVDTTAKRHGFFDQLTTARVIAGLVLSAPAPGLPVSHLPLTFQGVPERMIAAGLLREVRAGDPATPHLAPVGAAA